jgi:hypothetical protein
MAEGVALLSDDVVAVSADGALAYPGPRSIRLGGDAGEGKREQPVTGVVPAAVPVGAVLVLDRASRHGAPRLVPVDHPVRVLLAAAFVPYVDDSGVLASLLDACTELAARVPVLRLEASPSLPPSALAAVAAGAAA